MPLFDKVIVTCWRHPRAMALDQLIAAFGKHGVKAQAAENMPEALSLARSIAGARDLICVAGSLFVVAEAIEQASLLR